MTQQTSNKQSTEPTEPRELLCMVCGKEHQVWYADNPVWNAVMRYPDGRETSEKVPFICPTCFMNTAKAVGYPVTAWHLLPVLEHPTPHPTTDSSDMGELRRGLEHIFFPSAFALNGSGQRGDIDALLDKAVDFVFTHITKEAERIAGERVTPNNPGAEEREALSKKFDELWAKNNGLLIETLNGYFDWLVADRERRVAEALKGAQFELELAERRIKNYEDWMVRQDSNSLMEFIHDHAPDYIYHSRKERLALPNKEQETSNE